MYYMATWSLRSKPYEGFAEGTGRDAGIELNPWALMFSAL